MTHWPKTHKTGRLPDMPICYRSRHADLRHGRPKVTLIESESPIEVLVKASPETSLSMRYALGRDQAITAAYQTDAYTLIQIGSHFGIHQSTAGRIALRDEYV